MHCKTLSLSNEVNSAPHVNPRRFVSSWDSSVFLTLNSMLSPRKSTSTANNFHLHMLAHAYSILQFS